MYVEIGMIYNHIKVSNKKLIKESTEKLLIKKISKRLLELKLSQVPRQNMLPKKYCHHYKTCKLIS